MSDSTGTEVKDGRTALLSMLFGYFPAQALHVATRIGLPEHMADGPRPTAELAAATGCDRPALGRLLRGDHPRSMRNYVLLFCGEQVWQSWGDLEYSVRTGQPAWEQRYGPPFGPGSSGRERTADEFGNLLAAAGYTMPRIVPCPPTGYSLIEARLR